MKYMGSKRAMLGNGLGELLEAEVGEATRFVDLFAGSGAVAVHVARRFDLPVLGFDLQSYSAVLTGAVIKRRACFESSKSFNDWRKRAGDFVNGRKTPTMNKITAASIAQCRIWSEAQKEFPITRAYGGHYFSPNQAIWIDALRKRIPEAEPAKTVALASLIQAASQCAAAPGHTAQPFQPTRTAKRYLIEAWNKDIVSRTRTAYESLASKFARRIGYAAVADANDAAHQLEDGDLAFIDPPYSGVHYSRFYHVLETIAQGSCGEVTGTGRYPAPEHRPRSRYSVGSESTAALAELLETVSSRGARAILTFPDHECSNGLSGGSVREIASKYFRIREKRVASKFSTLGGTSDKDREGEGGRSARRAAKELMLVLEPRC